MGVCLDNINENVYQQVKGKNTGIYFMGLARAVSKIHRPIRGWAPDRFSYQSVKIDR